MRRNNLIKTSLATVLLAPAAAFAQVDTSDWKCEYCPFQKGYEAEIEAGGSYVNEDAARFGNGTGYDEKGGHVDLSGEGRSVSESGTEVTWYAEDLGLDSRVFELGFGKPGKFWLEFGYNELPYRRFGDTLTPFDVSGDTLALPAGWVRSGTTGGMTELAAALSPSNIEIDRQTLEVGADIRAVKNFRFYVDYRRQQRDGINIMGSPFYASSAYLPRPVDDYTDRFDAGVRYSNGAFNISLAYLGSFYTNDLGSLTWDNPFTGFPGTDQGRLALEPDNDFQQFTLSGSYRAQAWNTVVAFSIASGSGEQNMDLLPYTINPTIPAPLIQMADIQGKVDTSNYSFTVVTQPHERFNIRMTYRYDERDNKTPITQWTRVITDAVDSGDPESNIPYSFERDRMNVSGTFRLLDTVTVSGGYDRTDYNRTFSEVKSQTEDDGWGKLRWRPTPYLEATFKGGASAREVDDYDTAYGFEFGQNPLMRKYNLADRDREYAEVVLSASLIDTPLSIGMTYFWAEDDYYESEVGMTEAEENRYTVDFSWAVGERSSIYLNAGSDTIESVQIGSETFAGPLWEASHDDDFTHYGGGFRVGTESEKLDLTVDYTRSDGETEILFAGQAVAVEPLPDLESTMDSLRLMLEYNVSERFGLNFHARWERLEMEDWGLEGVEPDTISQVLTMGANPYDYDVWVFGVGFTYRMGNNSAE
ncbi:MAG: MtrB/PioB family decaheme-associated outer membrane protein [Woeseiaceae bacterium]